MSQFNILSNTPQVDTENGEVIDLTITYWQRTIAERIKEKVDQFYTQNADDGYRTHLGWSVIGHPCLRYLYYHFRWFWKEEHSARTERIFLAGHQIESELRHILKSMGAKFLDTVDEDGKQIKVSDIGGHFGGSADGVFIWPEIGLHEPTLLECKSTKTGAPFNELEKKTVAGAQPRHFKQQSGYGLHLKIKFACYMARNKNDSSLYVEMVELDWEEAEQNVKKAAWLINDCNTPPARISNKANYYVCNMCAIKPLCHEGKTPTPNCRNCVNAKAADNGAWFCGHWQSTIPAEHIPTGCPQHTFLPY